MSLAFPPLLVGLLAAFGAACHEEEAGPGPVAAGPSAAGPSTEAKQALARARELFAAEKPFEAITEAEKAAELAPEWIETHLALGKLLLTYSDVRFSTATIDRGRLAQATTHLEKACELDPKNADAAYWSGLALSKGEHFPEAARRLETAVSLKPDHGLALKELGLVRAAQGDAKGAIESLTRARALLPKDADIPLQLGLQLESEERLEEARDAYLAACDLNRGHPGPRSALVVLYGRLGDKEAAEHMKKEFERCRAFGKRITAASQNFDAHSSDPAACMGLAELYREAGMADEAAKWAERALRLDPKHEPAIELLRKLGKPVEQPSEPRQKNVPTPGELKQLRAIAPAGGGDAR